MLGYKAIYCTDFKRIAALKLRVKRAVEAIAV
jgi:hypothetical protein